MNSGANCATVQSHGGPVSYHVPGAEAPRYIFLKTKWYFRVVVAFDHMATSRSSLKIVLDGAI